MSASGEISDKTIYNVEQPPFGADWAWPSAGAVAVSVMTISS
jgi:hypothetical protein